MRREEFESRIRELLPDVSEKAMDRTISYIEELDQETEECAESLYDAFYVELALVKRDRGAEIAKALFDYGENFTFNFAHYSGQKAAGFSDSVNFCLGFNDNHFSIPEFR